MIHVGVVLFPGSNCEMDVVEAVESAGGQARVLWHSDQHFSNVDAVVLPGGFAHGDYLRPGAIARFSPIMGAVTDFAAEGGPVVGICNGFQVLTEAGLLPGALQKNRGLKFRCEMVKLRIEAPCAMTGDADVGRTMNLPINHFEGNYICSAETLAELRSDERVIARYVSNPNGSLDDIAGVCSAQRNVVGLMPHPERASHTLLGSIDGLVLIGRLLESASARLSAVH